MKQWAINILLLILCVAAILIALLKVTPFEITADTYVGSIVTLLSIAVAFVIGFQIYNAIELKKELAENKANYNRILAANEEMEKKYHEQQNQMEEGFSILSAIINKNRGQSFIACGNAFKAMHHAFIFSLETDCANTESMFVFLRQYISDFNFQTFTSGYAQLPDGRIIINIVGENEGKTLREVVDNYLEPIKSDEQQIRSNKNFCKIQIEYNRVMKLFYKRMEEIVTHPEKQLTPEEQEAIINPQ